MKRSPLLILFFTVFLDLVGFGIVLPLLPTYARELGASPLMIGIIAGSYSLMQFFFSPLWGGISDRVGRRPILLISITTSIVSYFIFSQSHTLILLLISRILAGIGSANVAVTQAYITDITDQSNRAKGLGILGAAFGLGFVLGPPIGGFLKTNYGFEYVGYVACGLTIIDLMLAYLLLPESLKEKKLTKIKFDYFHPERLKVSLHNLAVVLTMIVNFLIVFAFVNMQISVPLLWNREYGQSEQNVGYLFASIAIISVIIQGGLIGPLTKTLGERMVLFIGAFAMMFGIAPIPFVPTDSLFTIGMGVLAMMAIGNGLCSPATSALVSLYSPPEEQGEALGLAQSVGSLARIFGPLSGSLLYGVNYHAPFIIAGMVLFLAIMLSFSLFQFPKPMNMNARK